MESLTNALDELEAHLRELRRIMKNESETIKRMDYDRLVNKISEFANLIDLTIRDAED